MHSRLRLPACLLLGLAVPACDDVKDPNSDDHGQELITTVTLSLTGADGAVAGPFRWSDPALSGSPVIDTVTLSADQSWTVSVAFSDESGSPAEDITPEVEDEGTDHQVFFTGPAIEGPATGPNGAALLAHSYADADDNGDPIGLENLWAPIAPGSSSFTLTLRHMPPTGGVAVKTASTAETVASEGFAAIGGENDVQIDFPIEVSAD